MSIFLSATIICFIACHGGPADHFTTFAEHLVKNGYQVQIYATGPALKKFQDRQIKMITPFYLENISEENRAMEIAKKCCKASVVITDVGHSFDIALQNALSKYASSTLRLAYYDNPEPYVPGGYSSIAAKVMLAAEGVLFANTNLVEAPLYQTPSEEICLDSAKRIGLGYYPISQAEKIAKRRKSDREQLRTEFFSSHSLKDPKVLVYIGGNNDEYFHQAFPAFLQFLTKATQLKDLSNFVVLLQQHPGAKERNLDANEVVKWLDKNGKDPKAPRFFISEFNSDEAQVVADGLLYYQTSMGPQFVLAGIPTIQVGHKIYKDILVTNDLCSTATDANQLVSAISNLQPDKEIETTQTIKKGLGIRSDWADRLEKAITYRPF